MCYLKRASPEAVVWLHLGGVKQGLPFWQVPWCQRCTPAWQLDLCWLQLGWVKGEEGNLLLAEPLFTAKADRERLTQLAFEVFNVSGFFISDEAVLCLYAVAKQTGTMVDLGHSKTGALCDPCRCCRVVPAAQDSPAGHTPQRDATAGRPKRLKER